MTEREGYECLMLLVPAVLYEALVERAEAHGNSLAMEVLLMLERDVAIVQPRAGRDELRRAAVIEAALFWFQSYVQSTLRGRIVEDEVRLRDAVAAMLERGWR